MATSAFCAPIVRGTPLLPVNCGEQHWYAAYTFANHEKCVAQELEQRSVECFLPLYESVRRWRDRRVRLYLPLFPGYVFLRIALKERLRVLMIRSVVRLVGFNGLPAALPYLEIEALRTGLTCPLRAEPHPFLKKGRRVRIKSGPFAGMEGVMVRRKSNFRVVLSLELLVRSIVVDIDSADLEPIV
jgi:transcription antitermination factor NusG